MQDKIFVATPESESRLERIRWLADLMDAHFSLFGFRFGLDSVIGLFPGFGDVLGGLISVYIIWQAHLMGAPHEVTRRMLTNVVVDVFVGGIPVLGDMFDLFFKANRRNVRMIEEWVSVSRTPSRVS